MEQASHFQNSVFSVQFQTENVMIIREVHANVNYFYMTLEN